MRTKKTYSYRKVMDVLLNNSDVLCWGDLYTKLGVLKWFDDHKEKAGVKYIFSTPRFNQYISQILADRYYVSKRCFYTEKYAYTTSAFDSVSYSPTDADLDTDCIVVDLTGKTSAKAPKEIIPFASKLGISSLPFVVTTGEPYELDKLLKSN